MQFLISYIVHVLIFAAALGLGSLFTSSGLSSAWYAGLQLPPWQPPGWAFGAAWTFILFSFPVAAAALLPWKSLLSVSSVAGIFWLQVILNVLWNYLFFRQNYTLLSLVEIIVLFALVLVLTVLAFRTNWWAGLAALPYLIWLVIATSLNAYIWRMN